MVTQPSLQAKLKFDENGYAFLNIVANRNQLAAIGKFPIATGKLIIGKTLATSGEEITNAMISDYVLANYW